MRGYAAALAAFSIWGVFSSVFLRSIPLPGPVITCFSGFFGAFFLLLYLRPNRWWEVRALFGTHRRHLAMMAVAFAGCSLCFHWAVKTTTVANAVLTHSVQPVLTCVIFLPIARRRWPDRAAWIALVLGMAGLTILLWPQLSMRGPFFGIALGLLSAVCFAWFNVLIDSLETKLGQDALIVAVLLSSFPLMLPFALALWPPAVTPALAARVVLFGLLNSAGGNLFFFYAMRHAPVGHVATLAYIEPVVAIAAAAAFLGEPLSPNAVIGGLLVIASGALIVLTGSKKTPAS